MIAFLDLIDETEEKDRFKRLYAKYRGLMAHIASNKLDSRQDVEDVLQETFLYIAKNFDKVGDIDSPATKRYVAVITEGFAIKKFNKEIKHLYHMSTADEVDIDNTLSDNYFNDFDRVDLMMAVNSLNDEYRNLIYFTYVLGYTSSETAEIYGLSAENVRKKLQSARRELRKMLES